MEYNKPVGDAVRPLTPYKIAESTINLFVEYRDKGDGTKSLFEALDYKPSIILEETMPTK